MQIILCDLQPKLVEEWQKVFYNESDIKCVCGDIFQQGEADCIISPSQSFGFLTGGIDGIYARKFGPQVQETLQRKIKDRPMNELLVGEALLIRTSYKKIPFMISAPTMRVPMDIRGTINVYLAFKAALTLVRNGTDFESVLCPGLGTATGRLEPEICAKQMYQAYTGINFPANLDIAIYQHLLMGGKTNY
jgi:O-acetyl-ADP-ribose deacetylase (regulator of RNase III)